MGRCKRYVSRYLMILVFILIVLYILPGCENSADQKVTPQPETSVADVKDEVAVIGEVEQVSINWIGHWKGEAGREELVRSILKKYQFLHPEVQINLTFNVDLEGGELNYKKRAADAIIAMIETGHIDWDIVFLDIAVYEHVTEKLGNPNWVREHIVDFGQVQGFFETQKDFIRTDPRYREKIGGIFTGPYIEGYIHNTWVNTKLAELIGVDVKERDMTFEDFLGYAGELQRYNKENGSSIPFIKLCSWNRLDLLFENFFKSLFDDFASATDTVFSEEKKAAFWETLLAFEQLAQYQPILNPGWEQLTMDGFTREFLLDDDGLFIAGGTYMYGRFNGIDPLQSEKLRPVETPVLKKANSLIGDYTPVFAVMKNSPKRKVAEDFLLFWAKPEHAEQWVTTTKSPTGIRGHLAEVSMQPADVYEKFALDMQQKYNSTPMVSLRTPTYVFGQHNPVSVSELRLKLARILEGKLTAREFFDDAMDRLEERNAVGSSSK